MNNTTESILDVFNFGINGCFPIQGTHLFKWSGSTAKESEPPADCRCGCGEYKYGEWFWMQKVETETTK